MNLVNDAHECPLGHTSFFYETLVPKDLQENLAYRKRVLELCYLNAEFRREAWIISSRDILWFVGTFAWTISPKDYPDNPIRPFIPYVYQERDITEFQKSLGKEDIITLKSRDMGATWLCLLVMEHRWHFMPNQLFLLTSQKAELVDQTGNQKALFQKLDWLMDHYPKWIIPRTNKSSRIQNHLGNPDNGSSFDGEATVANMGTGDRRQAILLDETSKMSEAAAIATSTQAVSNCRVFNSTPNGRFGVGKMFYERAKNPHTKKFFMHWSEHPERCNGLYKLVNGKKVPLDETYSWRNDYDFEQLCFHGDNKPRSPWYDNECKRAASDKVIAQEFDMDFLGSSERFADSEVMARVMDEDVRDPSDQGSLVVDSENCIPMWRRGGGGPYPPFRVWCQFDGIKPPVSEYSAGVDISAGTAGEYTSNSAIVVIDKFTKEQVAEFATNRMKPEPFARYCVGVCKWFHDAILVPEVNGPLGTAFINEVKEVGYWNIYRRNVEQIGWYEKTKKLGYQNQDKGTKLLSSLQDAMAMSKLKIRSKAVVDELLEYEWEGGKLSHAGSKISDSESDKGMTHGDVAIAAGCSWLGVGDSPVTKKDTPKADPKEGSMAFRLKEYDSRILMNTESVTDW